MKKIRNWFLNKFLPAWAKETLLSRNKKLEEENRKLQDIIIKQQGYIEGLELGLRSQKRIIIKGDVVK